VASGFRSADRQRLIRASVCGKKGATPQGGIASKKDDHRGLKDECSRPFLRMRL
jgi:hypothetical protein